MPGNPSKSIRQPNRPSKARASALPAGLTLRGPSISRGWALMSRALIRNSTLDGPIADVLAVLLAFELDVDQRLVGQLLRLADRFAERRHAEHAAAGGEQLAVGF